MLGQGLGWLWLTSLDVNLATDHYFMLHLVETCTKDKYFTSFFHSLSLRHAGVSINVREGRLTGLATSTVADRHVIVLADIINSFTEPSRTDNFDIVLHKISDQDESNIIQELVNCISKE